MKPHYYVSYTIIRIESDGVVAYSPGGTPPPKDQSSLPGADQFTTSVKYKLAKSEQM